MIKAIFWDNDGVLVDTEGIFFRANQETLADLGISLGWEQFEEISLVRGGSVLQLAQKPGTEAFYKLRDKRDALLCRPADAGAAGHGRRPGCAGGAYGKIRHGNCNQFRT